MAPFWSPDSNMIGFAAAGKLKKVSVNGGPVISIFDIAGATIPGRSYISGGSWSPDGSSIVFAAGAPSALYMVSATGGTGSLLVSPQMLEEESAGSSQRSGWLIQPHFLSRAGGSHAVVITDARSLMVWDLTTRRHHVIGPGLNPFYASSGHLLYRSGSHRPFEPSGYRSGPRWR
jgi:serine/threonine-protein kinase